MKYVILVKNKILSEIRLGVFLLVIGIFYFLVTYNLLVVIFCLISTFFVSKKYQKKCEKIKKEKFLNFQINSFIKNMALNSMTNDFNVVDSMEKTLPFLEGGFKKDVELMIDSIKTDYDYQKASSLLIKKYPSKKVLIRFLKNLIIIKEQSNVDDSARKIFDNSSLDSRKYIVNYDKIYKVKMANLNAYFVNTFIGCIVILMVCFSLNVYYVEFANSSTGIFINLITILISIYITWALIDKTFEMEKYV